MNRAFVAACLIALYACDPAPPRETTAGTFAPPAPPASPSTPAITGLPVTLTLKQRSQVDIPGTSGALKLSIGDITRGQVQTSISVDKSEKDLLLQPTSLAKGDQKSFEYEKRRYELTLVELSNALVGEDFATFKLAEATVPHVPLTTAMTEAEKIDRLIARVESLESAKFIRNGSEYSPAEAAKHLREKRSLAGDQLKSAEDFIDQIGSRSSVSGNEYTIRYADGRVVKSGEFLRDELRKLSQKKATSVPAPPGH